jgi:hypothetical protein
MGKFQFLVLFSVLVLGCTTLGVVKKASLYNHLDGKETVLSEAEIVELNELIGRGIDEVKGEKWPAGNLIEVYIGDNETAYIVSFKGGYLMLSTTGKYYRVKASYRELFRRLFRQPET